MALLFSRLTRSLGASVARRHVWFPAFESHISSHSPFRFSCLLCVVTTRSESVWIRSGYQTLVCTRDRFSLVERVSRNPQRTRLRCGVSENASHHFLPPFFARSPSIELHEEKTRADRIDAAEIRWVFGVGVVSNLHAERVSTLSASPGASAAVSRSNQGALSHRNARANGERSRCVAGRNEVYEDQESDEQNLRNQTKTSMAQRRVVLSIHRFGEGGELF